MEASKKGSQPNCPRSVTGRMGPRRSLESGPVHFQTWLIGTNDRNLIQTDFVGYLGCLVKCLTLGLGSGHDHDLTVCGTEPLIGLCTGHWACLGLDFSISAPPPLSLSLSLSINEVKKKKLGHVGGWLSQLSGCLGLRS